LTELRATDLRFTSSEVVEFLNQAMGLNLSAEDIATLETRTEGWIAGLQLAAISMQGHEDATSFIKAFTGSHHFVIDYLVEEVLKHQTEYIRDFLLKTSILDRLTGPLCDAVTNQENGQATLEMLEHSNLFIIRLDSERQWYRYHHLFADLLRQRLNRMQPQETRTLHALASEWYEQQGLIDESIEHALQSKNYDLATRMINEYIEERWQQGKLGMLLRWLEKLPDDYINNNPNLCIFLAWNLFTKGDQKKAESVLQFIEKNLDLQSDLSSDKPIEKGETSARLFVKKIRGRVAAIRAVMATYRSDAIESKKFASLAQELLPVDDLNWRSAAAMALADAYVFMGKYDSAHQARFESIKLCEIAGNTYIYLIDRTKFILVLKARGELMQAKAHCQQLIEYAIDNGFTDPGTIGWIQAILGDILVETNDLDGAFEIVREGVNLTELGRDVTLLSWSNMCLTRILLSIGDFNGAENIIRKTKVMSQKATIPPLVNYQMMNYRVRVWLSQGRLDEAINWMREQMEDSESKSTFVGTRINIPIARIRIAQQLPEKANELLLPLLDAAEAGGHISRAIELLILQALSLQAGDEIEKALIALDKALSLAQSRGFIRIFVDEGPPMARLLYAALEKGITPEYVQKLLAAFPDGEPEKDLMSKSIASDSEWMEPLSDRELEVLQLIAEGISRQEIAFQLVLSLNTVKTHARNIYSKLGVNNQMQAVGKARGLGLLDQD
jgi:LuxR family maltose regulon positive regulatory protein